MLNNIIIYSILITIIVINSTDCVILSSDRSASSSHQTYSNQALYPLGHTPSSPDHCYRQSKCRPLNTSQCLDVTLPYKYTTSNVLENAPFAQIHEYLNRWKGLRSIPQCWKALQSVLCATFFPRCDNESSRVSLPTHEMCRFTRQPCRLIEQHYQWPEFLRCDNQTLFPNKCKNDYTDLKFNNTSNAVGAKCTAPLVSTDDQNIWYPGIEACALQCLNPIYTDEQHKKMSQLISHGAGISLVATLFSVFTFIVDWRSSNRYPAVIIFYLNMCFMIADTGWLWQSALTKGRTEIVCRPDNTSRYGEPGNSPENFYCLTVFLLIYYFSMAALVWFVNLAYTLDLSYQTQTSSTSRREAVNSKIAYFHLTAWSVPLMLSISIVALGEVDGDSLRGICFVGVLKPVMRICFVLVPTTVSLIIGCFYLFKAMLSLIKVKIFNKTQNNVNRNKIKKIDNLIIRIGLFGVCAITAVVINYVSHIYEFTHLSHWKKSLNDYIICTLNMTAALYPDTTAEPTDSLNVHSCKLADRPNLMYAYLELIGVFGAGILVSTWVWTSQSVAIWKRFIIRHLKPDLNEPIRLKRHEMISKVFGRRHQLTQGCYSPSFHSMHSDPVGMNLNSAVSQDLSATWAAALPNFMYRRGAIGSNANDPNINGQTTHYLPTFVGTRHSSNSDISQQRSYDSYRRSLDSQISLEQLEMVAIDRHHRRKTKKEREKLLKAHNSLRANPYHLSRRRGSDTSGSIISAALAIGRGFNKVSKSECKSTSTGDLMALSPNPMQQMLPQVTNPYMTPPITSPSSMPIHSCSTLAYMSPNQIPRARPTKPVVTNFTFTHGMSDQSSHLTNPLLERRRPDSCASHMHHIDHHNSAHILQVPNTTPNGSTQSANQNNLQFTSSTANPLTNYSLTYMNGINGLNTGLNNGLNSYIANAQSLNYFTPINTFYGNLLANSQANSYPNFIAPAYPTTPLPGMHFQPQYAPYPSYPPPIPPQPQPHCNNLQDVQALIREREAYLQLIRPMDSASELEDHFLPIQLSDSEGIYSPDLRSRNEGMITTQQLVDEHIQRVEAAVEAKGVDNNTSTRNETIVGALGDVSLTRDVLEMQSPKQSPNKTLQKSESKRKKKKSSKKHKTNGNIVNNNNNINNNTNNNDVNNDFEQQIPLMSATKEDNNEN